MSAMHISSFIFIGHGFICTVQMIIFNYSDKNSENLKKRLHLVNMMFSLPIIFHGLLKNTVSGADKQANMVQRKAKGSFYP